MTDYQRMRAAAETMMDAAHVYSLIQIEMGHERTLMDLVEKTRKALRTEASGLFERASRLEARAEIEAEQNELDRAEFNRRGSIG